MPTPSDDHLVEALKRVDEADLRRALSMLETSTSKCTEGQIRMLAVIGMLPRACALYLLAKRRVRLV